MSETVPEQTLRKLIAHKHKRLPRAVRSGSTNERPNSFAFSNGDIETDIMKRYHFAGDLLQTYSNGLHHEIHKRHHHSSIYDRFYSKWRNTPVRFFEIGVWKGGSQELWRKYLGDRAIVYGLDINKKYQKYDGVNGCVRIESQSDAGLGISGSENGRN